jgi:hypothetical protein
MGIIFKQTLIRVHAFQAALMIGRLRRREHVCLSWLRSKIGPNQMDPSLHVRVQIVQVHFVVPKIDRCW